MGVGTVAQMAQQVKTLPAMPDNLNLIPKTHMAEAEN